MRALIERFVFVVGQWTVDPSRRASGLDWVPPGQREQLTAFNATAAPIPAMPVPERLARWAAETPDAPVVGDGSYAELDERAGRLAGALDAGPGDVVAVCLPRGRELVAAALAAMRRGAAYLPLDVAYPPTRLAHILADGRPAAIVTTAALAEQLGPAAAAGRDRRRRGRPAADRRLVPRRARAPRLRDLHLRLDRHAEGGGGHARRAAEPGRLAHARPTRSPRPIAGGPGWRALGFDAAGLGDCGPTCTRRRQRARGDDETPATPTRCSRWLREEPSP